MKPRSPRLLAVGAWAFAGLLAFAVQAATPEKARGHSETAAEAHAHSHDPPGGAPTLKLDHGRKWAGDEALRTSMSRIATAVDENLALVHAGRASAVRYDALGREIEAQVANIVQNCRLEPAADEVLHAILATMLEGNEMLQGRKPDAKRSSGVEQVVRALEQYGDHFEHAGFEAPNAGR